MKVARPGTLLVDKPTRLQLDADRFGERHVRAFSFKGFDERVSLYRVKRAG